MFEPVGEHGPQGQGPRRSPPGGPSGSSPSAAAAAAPMRSRRRSSGATPSSGCSRTCSTRRRASADARLVTRSPGRPGSASPPGWEFEKYIDGLVETVWWHYGRSPAYGEGITFWALGEMVRARCGLLETDDADDDPAARSPRRSRSTCPTRPSAAGSSPPCSPCSGSAMRRPGGRDELFRGLADVLRADRVDTASSSSLFEDLHWADAGPARLRRPPARVEPRRRRSCHHARSPGAPRAAARLGRRAAQLLALGLEPLDEAAMRELLAGLVPGLPATAASLDRRARRRHPAVRRRDRPHARRRRAARARSTAATSPSASSASWPCRRRSRRSSRPASTASPPADRALLQDAAVLGQSFTLAGLAAVTGPTPDALEPRLRALVRHGAARPGGRPALAGARPVRVRPGADPRGRLQPRSRSATGGRAISPRPASSNRSARTSSPAPSPRTTWPPTRRRRTGRRATRSRSRHGSRWWARPIARSPWGRRSRRSRSCPRRRRSRPIRRIGPRSCRTARSRRDIGRPPDSPNRR